MKNLFLLAVVAGAYTLTSCKKDWTCECKNSAGTYPITLTNLKKADAKAA